MPRNTQYAIQNTKNGFTLIEVVSVIGIFLLMTLILGPFVHIAKERAHKVTCEKNLMRISLALHSYALQHNNKFPGELIALYPDYVDDLKVFDCPDSKVCGTAERPDYVYVMGLTEASPLKTIIVEDKDGNHGRAGRNALRIDGSVSGGI